MFSKRGFLGSKRLRRVLPDSESAHEGADTTNFIPVGFPPSACPTLPCKPELREIPLRSGPTSADHDSKLFGVTTLYIL